ncbi:MAG: hypothetical protein Q9218_004723 [Villophora microphyllina]
MAPGGMADMHSRYAVGGAPPLQKKPVPQFNAQAHKATFNVYSHAILPTSKLTANLSQTLQPNPPNPTNPTNYHKEPKLQTTRMSAPNAGRQSPEPEKQTDSQVGQPEPGQIDAAPSEEHAQEKSEDAKENVLSSNPEGPLEGAAHDKVSKEGRGV